MLEIIVYILGFLAFVILCQDFLLFPALVPSLLRKFFRLGSLSKTRDIPHGVESDFITASDGKRLEVWRLPADPYEEKQDFVALIFHGNGGSLESFLALQLWFSFMGITSYGIDYRGFGRSSGWPSEKGFYRDSDAFWSYVSEREELSPDRAIILGYSLGGPVAARLAAEVSPHTLLLISTFNDLLTLVKSKKLFRYLSRFLWYRLPTETYVGSLQKTNLILVHGTQDTIVDSSHLNRLALAYRGGGQCRKIVAEGSGHNDTFFAIRAELAANLEELL